MDKKGFFISFFIKLKKDFFKKAFNNSRTKNISQDGNKEWITIIAFIYTNRTNHLSSLIY